MSELMQANQQWKSRPSDERFESLPAMLTMMQKVRQESTSCVRNTRHIEVLPAPDHKGLEIDVTHREYGSAGVRDFKKRYSPTNWSFGQLASLAEAPAGYLRNLPSDIAADCLNYGLYKRDVSEVGLLVRSNGSETVRAATGPNYGRIWNSDIVKALMERFGDGVNGSFRIPGEFGKAVAVTKDNTTLFASDRDMFVFLADEQNRIEVPGRREGRAGSMARGFFCWNSEVGSATLGIGTFLFDYVCCNRIVWGAQGYKEITVRHTAKAPARFIEEVGPAIERYAAASSQTITDAIDNARKERLTENKMDEFIAKRFGKGLVDKLKAIHKDEELGRPIETAWDVVTAATAYARGVKWQDERVTIERKAGDILQ